MSQSNDADNQQPAKPASLRLPWLSKPTPVGLGDVIKNVTRTAGIKACTPCQRRADRMNRWITFVPTNQPLQVEHDSRHP